MINLFWGISHNILIYIWYYKIDSKIGEKLYKFGEAKGILIIKIYSKSKYILIFNKYIKEVFTILDL